MKLLAMRRFCFGCLWRRLQTNTSPCSICGKEWTRNANPESFATRVTRWLLRPLGRFTHALTIGTAMIFLWAATTHGPDFIFSIILGLLCLVIIVIWLGRALVRFIVAASFRRGGWAYPGWRNWLVAPIAALLVATLIQFDVPMRIAFRVSRPAMMRLAQSTLKLPSRVTPPNDVRVGMYRVTHIQRVHGGVQFNVADNGFMGGEYFGFAYFPGKKPESEGDTRWGTLYSHLSGNWYSFNEYDPF